MLNLGSGRWRMDPGHRGCSGDFLVTAARAAGVGQGGMSMSRSCWGQLPGGGGLALGAI